MEIKYKEFIISDDKSKLQLDRICQLLQTTYWAKDRPEDNTERAIKSSICFGVYLQDMQIGFARCVTDFATVYWLADVIIDDHYKGLGLGKALVEAVIQHEQLKGCFGILATRDAHGLYEKYGFHTEDGRFMRRPLAVLPSPQ